MDATRGTARQRHYRTSGLAPPKAGIGRQAPAPWPIKPHVGHCGDSFRHRMGTGFRHDLLALPRTGSADRDDAVSKGPGIQTHGRRSRAATLPRRPCCRAAPDIDGDKHFAGRGQRVEAACTLHASSLGRRAGRAQHRQAGAATTPFVPVVELDGSPLVRNAGPRPRQDERPVAVHTARSRPGIAVEGDQFEKGERRPHIDKREGPMRIPSSPRRSPATHLRLRLELFEITSGAIILT